ncbi:hypothetical protein BCY88_36510 [Paraburkholderia fungorum]|uniref:Uncharacterized protein n=1 Tax=Paraburkholderia fungorum TaxID=134537 RepID=A0A420FTW3_9BURK|nr:hypothetical protein BCY88_36510 [Paraburkholderia fungorum]
MHAANHAANAVNRRTTTRTRQERQAYVMRHGVEQNFQCVDEPLDDAPMNSAAGQHGEPTCNTVLVAVDRMALPCVMKKSTGVQEMA